MRTHGNNSVASTTLWARCHLPRGPAGQPIGAPAPLNRICAELHGAADTRIFRVGCRGTFGTILCRSAGCNVSLRPSAGDVHTYMVRPAGGCQRARHGNIRNCPPPWSCPHAHTTWGWGCRAAVCVGRVCLAPTKTSSHHACTPIARPHPGPEDKACGGNNPWHVKYMIYRIAHQQPVPCIGCEASCTPIGG